MFCTRIDAKREASRTGESAPLEFRVSEKRYECGDLCGLRIPRAVTSAKVSAVVKNPFLHLRLVSFLRTPQYRGGPGRMAAARQSLARQKAGDTGREVHSKDTGQRGIWTRLVQLHCRSQRRRPAQETNGAGAGGMARGEGIFKVLGATRPGKA